MATSRKIAISDLCIFWESSLNTSRRIGYIYNSFPYESLTIKPSPMSDLIIAVFVICIKINKFTNVETLIHDIGIWEEKLI